MYDIHYMKDNIYLNLEYTRYNKKKNLVDDGHDG